MQLKKSELIDAIRKNTESKFSANEVRDVFDTAIEQMKQAITEGYEIQINGFGMFKPTVKAARMARNPLTGENVEIAEHVVLKFKVSPTLKVELCNLNPDTFRNNGEKNTDDDEARPKAKAKQTAKAETETKEKKKKK